MDDRGLPESRSRNPPSSILYPGSSFLPAADGPLPTPIPMAETQIIERTPTSTTIRTGGGNGQRTVLPSVIPILPIRNIVVFPGTVMPLNVGRAKSKALLDEVMPGDKLIGVVTQRNADVEDPKF